MALKVVVKVTRDGQLKYVDRPTLEFAERLGRKARERASHVEPVAPWLRHLFHFLRKRVADESRAAAFTRRWPCNWQARILDDGKILGPFRDRGEAIAAEVEYLETRTGT